MTAEQRDAFVRIPADLSERDLGCFYTLSARDLEIIGRRRRPANRLGFAVHLSLLRFPGRTLADVPEIPERVVAYIAQQVDVDPAVFAQYGERDNTNFEQLDELRRDFGFQNCGWPQLHALGQELLPLALGSDRSLPVIETGVERFRAPQINLNLDIAEKLLSVRVKRFTAAPEIQPYDGAVTLQKGNTVMNIRNRARILVVASTLAAGVSLLPAAVQFVSAEGVQQTGPTGERCNLKGMDGDFVDPDSSDTTNNANITLSGLSGAPAMTVAGCGYNVVLPPPPPPTPTPTVGPVRVSVLSRAVGSALEP